MTRVYNGDARKARDKGEIVQKSEHRRAHAGSRNGSKTQASGKRRARLLDGDGSNPESGGNSPHEQGVRCSTGTPACDMADACHA